MATRDTNKLKALIFNTLNNDLTLRALLGGTGRVRHGNPDQLSQYPLVTYYIVQESDEPFNSDIGSNIMDSRVEIQSYTNSTSSEVVQDIDDRIRALLHGQQLSDTDVMVYSAYRISSVPIYEAEIKVWRIASTYSFKNVTL